MTISGARKKANQKWDAANMATLACKVKKEHAEKFRQYCSMTGTSPNAVLQDFVYSCIGVDNTPVLVKLAGDAPGGSGDVLTPEALKTAAEAAELAGESVPAFVGRAVATLAKQDAKRRIFERDLAKAKAPDIFRDLTDT